MILYYITYKKYITLNKKAKLQSAWHASHVIECSLICIPHIFNPDTTDQPKSLVADSEGLAEISVSQKNDSLVDSKESNKSPKRPNDETISNPKKKVSVTVTVWLHSYFGSTMTLWSLNFNFKHLISVSNAICHCWRVFLLVFVNVSSCQLKLTTRYITEQKFFMQELSKNAIILFIISYK